jgi:hypothetical protein
MKKILFTCVSALFIMITFSSCENWFDISAKSELKADDLLNNEQGFRDALIGCYASMRDGKLYGAQLTMTYMDCLGQYYSTAKTTQNSFYYAANYDYSKTEEEQRKDLIWKNLYNVVSNVNNVVNRIDSEKGVFPTGVYELLKGEALGLRAYLHFDILRMYAPAPSMAGGLQAKAIPYVDKFTNTLFEQLTVGQVLDRVVDDLTEARALLAEVDPYGPKHADFDLKALEGVWKGREYRMNYYAATALLARTLLYRGLPEDKGKAYQYAKEVIDSNLFPLISSGDLKSSDDNGFVKENIFSLEYPGIKDDIVNKHFVVDERAYEFLGINNAMLKRIFPPTLDMDYRRQWWLSAAGPYFTIAKYNASKRVPLIKVSELYLIAAETAPTLDLTNQYFNTLQYHRGLPNEEVTAENLQKTILAEYAKEFIGEGQIFYAYKRLNNKVKPILQSAIPNPKSVYVIPLPKENTFFK